jgi:hypothetical protein
MRQVPQLAERHENGIGASCSSQRSTSEDSEGASISTTRPVVDSMITFAAAFTRSPGSSEVVPVREKQGRTLFAGDLARQARCPPFAIASVESTQRIYTVPALPMNQSIKKPVAVAFNWRSFSWLVQLSCTTGTSSQGAGARRAIPDRLCHMRTLTSLVGRTRRGQ